jgi:hypothetical protein
MRWRSALLTAFSALALAACGGGGGGEQVEQTQPTVPAPTIDRKIAEDLAKRSEEVANLLESGDSCAAAEEAAALERDWQAAVDEIPELYLEDLGNVIHEIQAGIPACTEPPPAPQPPPTTDPGGDGDD